MDMQERVCAYWGRRADEYGDARYRDVNSRKWEEWKGLIRKLLPEGALPDGAEGSCQDKSPLSCAVSGADAGAQGRRPVRALDVGTGAGFYAFLLYDLGCEVTGIDYTAEMIENAVRNQRRLGLGEAQPSGESDAESETLFSGESDAESGTMLSEGSSSDLGIPQSEKHDGDSAATGRSVRRRERGITFLRMDAQDMSFEDESFDFIFTRNVTWTLPHPEQAYAEMVRVLAPGGRLVNFDANYGASFLKQDELGLTEKMVSAEPSRYEHPARSAAMLRERNDIAEHLSVCGRNRPVWDIQVLSELGIEQITVDLNIQKHAFGTEYYTPIGEEKGNPAPLFMVLARKE